MSKGKIIEHIESVKFEPPVRHSRRRAEDCWNQLREVAAELQLVHENESDTVALAVLERILERACELAEAGETFDDDAE